MIDIDVVVQKIEEKIKELEQITEFHQSSWQKVKIEPATNFYEIENRTTSGPVIKNSHNEAQLKKFLSQITKNVIIRNGSENSKPLNTKVKNAVQKNEEASGDNDQQNKKVFTPKVIEPIQRTYSLKKHQNVSEQEKTDHYCKICNRYFSKAYSLQRHMYLHMGYRPFHCTKCNYRFVQRSDLERHLSVHENNPKFECHICQNKFNTKKSLTHHLIFHEDATPFRCVSAGCTKKFRSNKMLRIHQIVNHFPTDKEFVCDFCGKRFMLKDYLKIHVKTHTLGGTNFIAKNRMDYELHQSILIAKKMKRLENKELNSTA